ncbi:MAG TPA: heavy-metal-associated domain-containing protein [Ensifer sp.]|jgi:copper chaperone|uniref:heavy-metal-associated domain-containing protein n=1 Tax=Ensifer sp. TaxID=1872086 RepID=UPI002E1466D4|nr:heavy-metal-associated domain-containing protein [Ensifer sp.]
MQNLKIDNMTCGHCAGAVQKAILSVDPQATIKVDLGNREVSVDSAALSGPIADALKAAGYDSRPA